MSFTLGRLPQIEFGPGAFMKLIPALTRYGNSVLIVTGGQSFVNSCFWLQLEQGLEQAAVHWQHYSIEKEPTAVMIDEAVSRFTGHGIDVVVGIGGGSALDSAKAIAGLLSSGDSVMKFLEGVGPELNYQGPSVPFIAVPTTAGTGSEVTRNAVLGRDGERGFKKSFRDEQLVAELAIIDPELLLSSPPAIIAANGMDALTQLLESRVSLNVNRMFAVLAEDGLRAVRDGLIPWFEGGESAAEASALMAYAAFLSGLTLAHVGLGSVHGLAAPLGAFYPIPHGVACGAVLAEATAMNIQVLQQRLPQSPALNAYSRCAEILLNGHFHKSDQALEALINQLRDWQQRLNIPGLAQYGLDDSGIDQVVAHARGNSMKTNPVELTDAELKAVLQRCL